MKKFLIFLFPLVIGITNILFSSQTYANTYGIQPNPPGNQFQFQNTQNGAKYLMNPSKIGGVICNADFIQAFKIYTGESVDPCFAIQNYDVGLRWGYSITSIPGNSTYKNNSMRFYWSTWPSDYTHEFGSKTGVGNGLIFNPENMRYVDISFTPSNTIPEYCTIAGNKYCYKDVATGAVIEIQYVSFRFNQDFLVAGDTGAGVLLYPILSNFRINYPEDYTGFIIPFTLSGDEVAKYGEIIDTLTDDNADGVALGGLQDAPGWLPPGPVDSIMTLALGVNQNLLSIMSSPSCPLVVFAFPEPFPLNLTVPCFKQTLWQEIGLMATLFDIVGWIAGGLMAFVAVKQLYSRITTMIFTMRHNSKMDVGEI